LCDVAFDSGSAGLVYEGEHGRSPLFASSWVAT
jgi:hypothetical protein